MTRIMDKIKELPCSGGALGRDYPSRCEWCEVEMNKFLQCPNRTWVDIVNGTTCFSWSGMQLDVSFTATELKGILYTQLYPWKSREAQSKGNRIT